MDARETLIKARELIADPERWTQGYYAETEAGSMVTANNPRACKWCAEGALMKVTGVDTLQTDASKLLDKCAVKIGGPGVMFANHLNDNSNHQTVLRMFDLAIERAA